MKKVYVVTCEQYNDFPILAIFSNKATADKFCELGQSVDDLIVVDEWELNDDSPQGSWFCTTVYTDRNGVTDLIYTEAWPSENTKALSYGKEFEVDNVIWLISRVMTYDRKHAIEITNERRMAIIAAGAWGDSEKSLIALEMVTEEQE